MVILVAMPSTEQVIENPDPVMAKSAAEMLMVREPREDTLTLELAELMVA